jgi:uncharacterized protein YndB with AHSA1/START domain
MAVATSGTARVTLPADDQILIEREFAAPPRLVWRAVTEPELVRRWWHACRGEMTVCEIDLRVGGSWRYAMRPEGREEFAFYGEFLELVPHERIVQTETFAPFPDDASTNTMTLTERDDGSTLLRTLVQHQTAYARDMHINSGMEGGMQVAFDRLEEVAISLAGR